MREDIRTKARLQNISPVFALFEVAKLLQEFSPEAAQQLSKPIIESTEEQDFPTQAREERPNDTKSTNTDNNNNKNSVNQ